MKNSIPDLNGEGCMDRKNILDRIKYSDNRVRRFSDSEMGTGMSMSYSSRPEYPIKYILYKYNIYLFILLFVI